MKRKNKFPYLTGSIDGFHNQFNVFRSFSYRINNHTGFIGIDSVISAHPKRQSFMRAENVSVLAKQEYWIKP